MTQRRGFTLIESVLAAAISAVLLLGLASSMLIASHALPGGERDRTADAELSLAPFMAQLRLDVQSAVRVPKLDARGIAVCSSADCEAAVAYAWPDGDGTISRKQRNGAEEVVLSGVRSFTCTPLGDGSRLTHLHFTITLEGEGRSASILIPLWNRPEGP